MNSRHKSAIRWLAAIGLLAGVALAVDFGSAFKNLRAADPGAIAIALLLVQGQIVISALRWRYTAGRLGLAMSVASAIREYYLASLLNLVLPGGVSGDAVRAVRAAGTKTEATDRPATVRAVILERLAGQVALFALALVGLCVWLPQAGGPPGGSALMLAVPVLAIAAGAAVVVVLGKAGPRRSRRWFADFGPDLRRAWFQDGAWLYQGASSLAVALLYVAAFAAASLAVGAALSWQAALALVPLVLLAMLVPVSIGGFGLREGAAASLWPLAGLSAAQGLAASLLYGFICIVGALPGALVLVKRRRSQAESRA